MWRKLSLEVTAVPRVTDTAGASNNILFNRATQIKAVNGEEEGNTETKLEDNTVGFKQPHKDKYSETNLTALSLKAEISKLC